MRMFVRALLYAAVLGVVYLVPLPLDWVGRFPEDTVWFVALLVVNPAVTLLAGALAGYRDGFAWPLLPLAALAWAPAALAIYGRSALPYALLYVVFCLAGLGLGYGVRTLRGKGEPARPRRATRAS